MFHNRCKLLRDVIKQRYECTKNDLVVFFAGFEQDSMRFRQESSFYYFTGCTEPGAVFVTAPGGESTLYIPHFGDERVKWTGTGLQEIKKCMQSCGISSVEYLGKQCSGYQFKPFFSPADVSNLLEQLRTAVNAGGVIYTLCPETAGDYVDQRHMLTRLCSFVPELNGKCRDISTDVAALRRKKDMNEIELLFKAIEITTMAHEAAAQVIAPNIHEYQVQAALEYIFTEFGAQRTAYPSIVASGSRSTSLHYDENRHFMELGDLVVVDIGAEYNHYCADLTRTYPVAGTFTQRQREIYNIVLDTQAYIVDCARPGYCLYNAQDQEQSLHHLAVNFLKKHGYDNYFPHSIGHFLGLDVHDVGDKAIMLEKGDVFTIEPGIYIPQEHLGVRIEDNYMMGVDGVICLSQDLPSNAHAIQKLVRTTSPSVRSSDPTGEA